MDKIVIIEGAELETLKAWLLEMSQLNVIRVRVTIDEGAFKIKAGNGTWSPPFGQLAPESASAGIYVRKNEISDRFYPRD